MHPEITWPLAKNKIRRGMVNHTFGMVRRNANGTKRPHQGWDFEARDGTPCLAIASGTIEHVRSVGAYGNQVVLRFAHDWDRDGDKDTLFAFYAHLARVDVRAGERVAKGQRIGLTGSTGNAAGMAPADQHLHFELRTIPLPGSGLAGRISPLNLFGVCPLETAL